jgi:hypothetical protein
LRCQTPGESEIGVTALNHFARYATAEKDDHRDDAIAQRDHHERADELRDCLSN